MKTLFNRATIENIKKSLHASTADGYGSWKLWRKITFFVAFPSVCIALLNAFLVPQKEHHERPPFVPYEYMRVRTKRFPWGDGQRSLFHNSHVNALPSGYEEH